MQPDCQNGVKPDATPASKVEAIRRAKEALGDAAPAELAAYAERKFRVAVKPAIARVILGTLLKRGRHAEAKRKARELAEQAKAEEVSSAAGKKGRRKKAPKAADGGQDQAIAHSA